MPPDAWPVVEPAVLLSFRGLAASDVRFSLCLTLNRDVTCGAIAVQAREVRSNGEEQPGMGPRMRRVCVEDTVASSWVSFCEARPGIRMGAPVGQMGRGTAGGQGPAEEPNERGRD
jgi:hypothetical protein